MGFIVTNKTRGDLVADPAIITQMDSDSVDRIYISNTDGVLTAFCVGGPLTA